MSGIPSQSRFGCYIGNIDRSVTIDMLKQVFCQCGTIIDCSLNGREGDPYRFGFIDFATEDDRARAMKYNGFTLVGRKLKVGISKGNVNKPEGFSTGNPGGVSSPGHNSDRLRRAANPYGEGSGVGGGDGSVGAEGGGGLSTQQQIEARLLLQFLQEGKMDPRQLSPAQQQLLIASLGQGSGNAGPSPSGGGGGAMAPMASHPSPQPPVNNPMAMEGGMGGGYGGYGGASMIMPQHQQQQHYHQQQQQQQQQWGMGMAPPGSSNNMSYNAPYPSMGGRYLTPPQQQHMPPPQQPPQQQSPYGANGVAILGGAGGPGVNAMPTTDTLRLREKQREQYFDVVRRETERYERKVQERKTRAAAGGAERSDSSDDDEDDKPSKKSKKDNA